MSETIALVRFKSIAQYPFVLGLFNFALLGFMALTLFAQIFMIANFHCFCCCSSPPTLIPYGWFAGSIHSDYLLTILLVFAICVSLETLVLSIKSFRLLNVFDRLWVSGGWLIRAFLKNLSGLLSILVFFALYDYQLVYFILMTCSIFFIFFSQVGTFKGYELSLVHATGWIQPSQGFLRVMKIFVMTYVFFLLLFIGAPSILIPLIHFGDLISLIILIPFSAFMILIFKKIVHAIKSK